MKCFVVISSVLALLISSPGLAKSNWKKAGWEKIDSKQGINVYRKEVKGSDVLGVGGTAIVNASAAKILWVLMDNAHKDEWIDKFKSAKTLETPTPLTSVQYASFDMPFPVSDRDFVYAYEFSYDKAEHMIEVDVKSVSHENAPDDETIGVRGDIKFGKYRLYPSKDGKKTYVEVEYLADPKGSLPTFIVNIVQKSWPYKTLSNLRKQVQKSFVKEDTKILSELGVSLTRSSASID